MRAFGLHALGTAEEVNDEAIAGNLLTTHWRHKHNLKNLMDEATHRRRLCEISAPIGRRRACWCGG
jgi:hypothetical protein